MTPERWQRVKTILAEAVAVPSDQRALLLDARCESDPALREEVESLLAVEDADDGMLDSPIGLAVPALEADERLAPETPSLLSRGGWPGSSAVVADRYQIVRYVGGGGMGEVFEARDLVLERTVAIKILPAELAASTERQQRFAREARIVAALSHPNICATYDTGIHDGLPFLVMELVEGQTLAERLTAGPLPLQEALRSGLQMAEAIGYAHRRGIIHRDLKPANVMLTPSGVKLLDFGLAKVVEGQALPGTLANEATTHPRESGLTEEGAILGTLEYMAPEQLEGRPVDARTDIFALGAVVYEMVTGTKAFTGDSRASLVAAILRDQPPAVTTRRPVAPPALDEVIGACLAKAPDARWQSAQDVATALRSLVTETRRGVASWVPLAGWVTAGLLAVVLAGVAGWAVLSRAPREAEAPVRHLAVVLPSQLQSVFWGPSLSPDGNLVAFVAAAPNEPARVWIRSMGSSAFRSLPDTDGALRLFWAPDSRNLAFYAEGHLKRISVTGRTAENIADVTSGLWGGTWSQMGTIVFAVGPGHGLFEVPATGGTPRPLTTVDAAKGEQGHLWPSFLPDGRSLLYSVMSGTESVRGIYVTSPGGPAPRRVVDVWSAARYAPEGYLVYARNRALEAVPFDAGQLTVTGEARVIREDATNAHWGFFSVAPGAVAYLTAPQRSHLVWTDRAGRETGVLGPSGTLGAPVLSPDDQRVAVQVMDPETGTDDIWVYDVAQGGGMRLTRGMPSESDAVWDPDGRSLAFSRDGLTIQRASAGGGGEEQPLFASRAGEVYPNDWSSDGKWLIYSDFSTSWADLWLLPLRPPGDPRPFRISMFSQHQARFSPDARWVAYASDESGRVEVYVQALPPSPERIVASTGGGSQPMWRRDGRELFYVALDGTLMAVDFSVRGVQPVVGQARPLFPLRVGMGPFYAIRNHYAVDRGGERFLVNRVTEGAITEFSLVFNWVREMVSDAGPGAP